VQPKDKEMSEVKAFNTTKLLKTFYTKAKLVNLQGH